MACWSAPRCSPGHHFTRTGLNRPIAARSTLLAQGTNGAPFQSILPCVFAEIKRLDAINITASHDPSMARKTQPYRSRSQLTPESNERKNHSRTVLEVLAFTELQQTS